MRIKIAEDFSSCPGSRKRAEGKFSGEEFLKTLLLPQLLESVETDFVLLVDLDGSAGYSCGFLEEAFGGLVRLNLFTPELLRRHLLLISNEEPALIDEINGYINDAWDNQNLGENY